MLNEKGRNILEIMLKNMISIDKKYQPKDGTDTELSKTIRILAEAVAVLIKIILEADEMIITTARIDKETIEDTARLFAMLREDDTYQS